MRFFRITYENRVHYALWESGGYRLLTGDLFGDWKPGKQVIAPEKAVILAPCVPSKIVAIGLNYRSHAKEMNMNLPTEPLLFLKPPTALASPGDSISWPAFSRQVEYEGELTLVIGRRCKAISEQAVPDYLLGYTLANDVTARDLQKKDGQWARAKGFDRFCPLGPCIATDLALEKLEFRTWLNDELKQIGRINDMIFSIPKIVSFVSHVMTLLPGDVILTGTPPGVGPMRPGDRVRVECEQIGSLENEVVEADESEHIE